MKTIRTTWTGIRPLVMHNGLLADPTNPYTRRIKEICGKGSKKLTDADYEERDALEWLGALYFRGYGEMLTPEGKAELFMPSDNIERCIQLGAQKSRLGKDVQAAVFCTEAEIPLQFEGPKDLSKLQADPRFSLRKGVKVTTSRIIRVRPMLPTSWKVTFGLEFDESIVNEKSLIKAMNDAGALVGLGDWRPKFGRFIVEMAE